MTLKTRLLYLLIGWLSAGITYSLTSFVKGNTWLVPELYIDHQIPFSPSGIWMYLMFYIYIPYTFITAHESKIKLLSISFILCACISGVIFIIYPSTIIYPDFEINGINSYCLNFVKTYDTAQNCFPSLHGSLLTLCAIANFDKTRMIRNSGHILLTLLMYYSIIQVRRHVFIDLAAGISIALIAWVISVSIFTKLKKSVVSIG